MTAEMVEVSIDSVRVSLMSPQRLVVLRQLEGDRYLPIWVGPYEAEAITVALQEIEMIRPLTHDLLKNVFGIFGARVRRVEINALREDIFYGNIVLDAAGQTINVDSRPSDAIALAVRARVPIFVHQSVMNAAGIVPEQDLRNATPGPSTANSQPTPTTPGTAAPSGAATPTRTGADDTSRLSIFEDFLSKLEPPRPPDKDADKDNDKPKE